MVKPRSSELDGILRTKNMHSLSSLSRTWKSVAAVIQKTTEVNKIEQEDVNIL